MVIAIALAGFSKTNKKQTQQQGSSLPA